MPLVELFSESVRRVLIGRGEKLLNDHFASVNKKQLDH